MSEWWRQAARPPDAEARDAAVARQGQLTKPPGSLGRLEETALSLAAMQARDRPVLAHPWVTVFAGDHGVVEEGVAAYPQDVTRQMLLNFVAGGAAVAVMARETGARLEVVDAGTLAPEALPGVIRDKPARGTANIARAAAMTPDQLDHVLAAGRRAVERALTSGADIFIGGEMGIGNTTVAAAVGCALLGLAGRDLAGPGTGLNLAGVTRKSAVIDRALALHGFAPPDANGAVHPAAALAALSRLGGFELAALAGAYIACAQAGLPVLVDGFITTAAALAACRLNPGTRPWLLFAHRSAEPGHARLLAALEARPLLDLGMGLGEGSGALAALPLLRLACALHADMATFAEAGVSGRA
jgi:nicotinate-nucleotide--dimethylbenzimidazole phosphoribosyltransferase